MNPINRECEEQQQQKENNSNNNNNQGNENQLIPCCLVCRTNINKVFQVYSPSPRSVG